ncbi:MAG: response regulator [Bacteroidetes bacterium]|nr:response regulator [Bacteroidota bacterium]
MKNRDNEIMYIDDEEPNLIAFRALFRREYFIHTATDAEVARTILDENPTIKVIISDHRMQGATGIEFFESILAEHPDPIRIILTGFADQKAMIDSINRARVYRFLSKPWNEHDLRQTILSAIEIYDTRKDLTQKQKKVEIALDHLNKFIHTASNEMRSTLVSMHGIVRLMMSGTSEIDPAEYLPLLEKGIVEIDLQLRNIINHYNSRRHLSDVEEIDLEEAVRLTSDNMEAIIDTSRLNIRISNPSKAVLFSDNYKVQLVFNNLISHALNNLNPGQTSVDIDIEIANTDTGVQIVFTDNGKAVEEDLSDSLFDAMISGKGRNSITLYLVKEAIQNLGGSLEIDSVPNAGTSYTLLIPNQNKNNGDLAA